MPLNGRWRANERVRTRPNQKQKLNNNFCEGGGGVVGGGGGVDAQLATKMIGIILYLLFGAIATVSTVSTTVTKPV